LATPPARRPWSPSICRELVFTRHRLNRSHRRIPAAVTSPVPGIARSSPPDGGQPPLGASATGDAADPHWHLISTTGHRRTLSRWAEIRQSRRKRRLLVQPDPRRQPHVGADLAKWGRQTERLGVAVPILGGQRDRDGPPQPRRPTSAAPAHLSAGGADIFVANTRCGRARLAKALGFGDAANLPCAPRRPTATARRSRVFILGAHQLPGGGPVGGAARGKQATCSVAQFHSVRGWSRILGSLGSAGKPADRNPACPCFGGRQSRSRRAAFSLKPLQIALGSSSASAPLPRGR
jgi:hypothetical protein